MASQLQLDEQSARLFRIRRTVMQMLRDRDYLVADFEISMSKDEFRDKFGDEPKRDDLVISKSKRANSSEQVLTARSYFCIFLYSFFSLLWYRTDYMLWIAKNKM